MSVKTRRLVVYDCKCERCGYEWTAFRLRPAKLPVSCANCKSRSWNVPEGSVPLGRPKN